MTIALDTGERLLQAGTGEIHGEHYLPTRVGEARWGRLPNAADDPVLGLPSGATVTLDTLSHEGIHEDQGRDPRAYFGQFGVTEVLDEAVELAASEDPHTVDDGPHVVTGPVQVDGALPGDLLRVDILGLERRVPYGLVTNRHGRGALPGEFPEAVGDRSPEVTDLLATEGTVSHFAWVGHLAGREHGFIAAGAGRTVRFPLTPFLGLMGTAVDTTETMSSVPPGPHGGNLDIKHAVVGTSLYLPVSLDGASFFAGDPHFAQGNGEVALTAFEASLRATLRLSVVPAGTGPEIMGGAWGPFLETPTHWILTGLDADLNEAVRQAVRNAIAFLHERMGVPRSVAFAYLSAAADLEVSQVVDQVKGVHYLIAKADWTTWT